MSIVFAEACPPRSHDDGFAEVGRAARRRLDERALAEASKKRLMRKHK